MTQYNEYGSIPQQIRDIVANKIKVLDEYILFQTGENEWCALIHDLITDEVVQLMFTRSSSYGAYFVTETVGNWEFTVTNQYYCYSNVGLGAALDLPVYDGVQAHSSIVLIVVLMFLVVFRSTLFPFRKNRK